MTYGTQMVERDNQLPLLSSDLHTHTVGMHVPINTVLVMVSIAVVKHHDQKQPEEGRRAKWSTIQGSYREHLGQKLMQSPWRNPAYWLALHGLLSLLSYST